MARPIVHSSSPIALPAHRNPVLDRDFADPGLLRVGPTYYAYATNSAGIHVQVARSTNLVNWDYLGEALPHLPDWAVPRFKYTWAPTVFGPGEAGEFIMYYVTRYNWALAGTQAIGRAIARCPEGPFTPIDDAPTICHWTKAALSILSPSGTKTAPATCSGKTTATRAASPLIFTFSAFQPTASVLKDTPSASSPPANPGKARWLKPLHCGNTAVNITFSTPPTPSTPTSMPSAGPSLIPPGARTTKTPRPCSKPIIPTTCTVRAVRKLLKGRMDAITCSSIPGILPSIIETCISPAWNGKEISPLPSSRLLPDFPKPCIVI